MRRTIVDGADGLFDSTSVSLLRDSCHSTEYLSFHRAVRYLTHRPLKGIGSRPIASAFRPSIQSPPAKATIAFLPGRIRPSFAFTCPACALTFTLESKLHRVIRDNKHQGLSHYRSPQRATGSATLNLVRANLPSPDH